MSLPVINVDINGVRETLVPEEAICIAWYFLNRDHDKKTYFQAANMVKVLRELKMPNESITTSDFSGVFQKEKSTNFVLVKGGGTYRNKYTLNNAGRGIIQTQRIQNIIRFLEKKRDADSI